MTEFLHHTYTQRCRKELKQILKNQSNNSEDSSILRFQACFYKPLLNETKQLQPLRFKLEQCLATNDINDERFLRCKSLIMESREKGDKELYDLLVKDLVSVNMIQDLDRLCPDQAMQARFHQCHLFPGKPECAVLKEKTFPFVANGPCKQVFEHANQCVQESSKMETGSLWKYLFKGQDIGTKNAHDRLCAKYQSDMYNCFIKYFTAMAIRNPDQLYQIHKQGPLSKDQIAEKEAYAKEEASRRDNIYSKK
jgi:hypothetical protein